MAEFPPYHREFPDITPYQKWCYHAQMSRRQERNSFFDENLKRALAPYKGVHITPGVLDEIAETVLQTMPPDGIFTTVEGGTMCRRDMTPDNILVSVKRDVNVPDEVLIKLQVTREP